MEVDDGDVGTQLRRYKVRCRGRVQEQAELGLTLHIMITNLKKNVRRM